MPVGQQRSWYRQGLSEGRLYSSLGRLGMTVGLDKSLGFIWLTKLLRYSIRSAFFMHPWLNTVGRGHAGGNAAACYIMTTRT